MKALILSPFPERISGAVEASGCAWEATAGELGSLDGLDWLISFGYRHILKPEVLDRFPNRAVNIHISYLPWNRGADPNFWSWFDATPKGVSLHLMDKGVDTGPILKRAPTFAFGGKGHDLRSSYGVLMRTAAALFADAWPDILSGKLQAVPQTPGIGTTHKAKDRIQLLEEIKWIKGRGWDVPCEEIERLGEAYRAKAA